MKLTERQEAIMDLLKGYSYNAMEICRMLNGIEAFKFKGCYFHFDVNRRGKRCRCEERGCQYWSQSIDSSLRAMQKKGLVRSIKLRWFDGRSSGAAKNSLPTDVFRFYYLSKGDLALKLIFDINKHLLGGIAG